MAKDVSALFNKFAGKQVDPKQGLLDPVIQGVRRVADENELKLRVWWPGTVGTRDYRFDRVNVHVKKMGDKHYISRFEIG